MVTKHFYSESQRVATKLAESNEGLLQNKAGGNKIDYTNKQAQLQGYFNKQYADLDIELEKVDGTPSGNSGQTPPNGNAYGQGNGGNGGNGGGNNGNGNNGNTSGGNGNNVEAFVFYYHPDHLGSSSYISDANGEVTQHLEYFAFGEMFLEEHSNTEATPYLFNGKELDEETGLYYYGARYYDAKTSVWQSVDPLAEKTPNESPYIYCGNNPIVFIDPDGRFKVPIHEKIIQEAMANLGYKRYDHMAIWTSQQTWDSFGAMNDEIHFDNRFTSGQVYSSWNILNQRIAKAKLGNVNDPMTHFGVDNDIQLGGYMHTIGDFYSHSNYIELYLKYYADTNNGATPKVGDIPIYDDAIKNKDFKQGYLDKKLKTGAFNVWRWLFGNDEKKSNSEGHIHHDSLNKDDNTTPEGKKVVGGNTLHEYARSTTVKHVEKVLKNKS